MAGPCKKFPIPKQLLQYCLHFIYTSMALSQIHYGGVQRLSYEKCVAVQNLLNRTLYAMEEAGDGETRVGV